MRKLTLALAPLLIIATLTACGGTADAPALEADPTEDTAAPTEEAAEEAIAYQVPLDLLDAPYNPFADVDFPESCDTYKVSHESGEYELYRVYMVMADSAENTVRFFSELVGDSSEESIAQNLEFLAEGGLVIPGDQVTEGFAATVEISPTDPEENSYEYVEGYAVTLTIAADPEMKEEFSAILDKNWSTNALESAGFMELIRDAEPVSREVKVLMGAMEAIQVEAFYEPGDESGTWMEYLTAPEFTDSDDYNIRQEDGMTNINYNFGELSINIMIFEEGKFVMVNFWLNGNDLSIADYNPE